MEYPTRCKKVNRLGAGNVREGICLGICPEGGNVRIPPQRDIVVGSTRLSQFICLFVRRIKTAEQRTIIQQYSDWYTGR